MRSKIRLPYQTLTRQVTRLRRLQQALDALRRTSRFIVLGRRLSHQLVEMNTSNGSAVPESVLTSTTEDTWRDGIVSKAALSIAELGERNPCKFASWLRSDSH
jgi:hypothetical protein